MKQHILRTLASLLLIAAPVAAMAAPDAPLEAEVATPTLSADLTDVSIEMEGRTVHVRNAQGLSLDVFDITGKLITSVRIDSNDKRVPLNLGKGCYLIRVGKVTRKIALA